MNPATADVVWLDGPGRLRIAREPLREPGAGEVACETLVTAISPGTELAAWQGLPPLHGGKAYPRLQGYCNVARVIAAGAAVESLRVGDRILGFTSHRSHFVQPAADALVRLPDGVRSSDAACAYLFHLGYNAVLRSGVRAGSRVLVIGLGVLGLAAVAMAARAGATVVAVSSHATARSHARALGATEAIEREMAATHRSAWADAVITTSNRWDDWPLALASAATRGCIAVLGFPGRGEGPPPFNPLDSRHFYARQLTIEAVGMSPERPDERGFARFNERDNLAWIVAEIAGGRLDATRLATATFPAAEIAEAYDSLLRREGSPVTYLLSWND